MQEPVKNLNDSFRRQAVIGQATADGRLTTLLSHSACVISVSSLFPKLPPRDAMQTRADLFSYLQFRAPDN